MPKNAKSLIKIIVIIIVVTIVASYSYYQFKDLLNGPQIEIFYPENGITLSDPLLEISGKVKNISKITLNDRNIFITEEGNFKEDLLLLYGYNIIEIEAQDRFGKIKKEVLEVVYN